MFGQPTMEPCFARGPRFAMPFLPMDFMEYFHHENMNQRRPTSDKRPKDSENQNASENSQDLPSENPRGPASNNSQNTKECVREKASQNFQSLLECFLNQNVNPRRSASCHNPTAKECTEENASENSQNFENPMDVLESFLNQLMDPRRSASCNNPNTKETKEAKDVKDATEAKDAMEAKDTKDATKAKENSQNLPSENPMEVLEYFLSQLMNPRSASCNNPNTKEATEDNEDNEAVNAKDAKEAKDAKDGKQVSKTSNNEIKKKAINSYLKINEDVEKIEIKINLKGHDFKPEDFEVRAIDNKILEIKAENGDQTFEKQFNLSPKSKVEKIDCKINIKEENELMVTITIPKEIKVTQVPISMDESA